MGAAKRRAQAAWSKSICPTCRHLGRTDIELTDSEVSAYELAHPHTCYDDPGPQPKVELTAIEIVIPRRVAVAIDELHQLVEKHYLHRNDFLGDLLKEGLKSAVQAQQAAVAQMQADALAAQAKEAEGNLIQLATERDMKEASARLRALRGGGAGPQYGTREGASVPLAEQSPF